MDCSSAVLLRRRASRMLAYGFVTPDTVPANGEGPKPPGVGGTSLLLVGGWVMSAIKLGRRPGLAAARPSDMATPGVIGGPGVYGVNSVAVEAVSDAAGVVKAVDAVAMAGVAGMVSDSERRLGLGRFMEAGWWKKDEGEPSTSAWGMGEVGRGCKAGGDDCCGRAGLQFENDRSGKDELSYATGDDDDGEDAVVDITMSLWGTVAG